MTQPVRVAVVGVGAFGQNHVRVLKELPSAQLVGVYDQSPERAHQVAATAGVPVFNSLDALARHADAAIVAVPTLAHHAVASHLLQAGLDVLVEKPIASTVAEGETLVSLARQRGRILQAGHLERYNPAVLALQRELTLPLFFEVHRMSVFTPRSLDVDVVLDLMIHDLDIVLACVGEAPSQIHASGIQVMSPKVDIANVRLSFPGGCVANLTASRVSTDRIRKLRLFQPDQYISLDYSKQDGVVFHTTQPDARIQIRKLDVQPAEPLRRELEDFLDCVLTRRTPGVDGVAACRALGVAEAILAKIKEHGDLVSARVAAYRASQPSKGATSPRDD
ncbi:MAG: Gfo/Idh/MocA family oxidoreductase [Bryobacterales bacterium]|jgi:predicted dehydrogenase|nr:Gfo/Idh/MocA family oxidoreductase [Bryobacterales bacterium]